MADNTPKDDNAFEDADFEDLDSIEDEDDLGDDSWDDFDETPGAADPLKDTAADTEDEVASGAISPKGKSFVQKNFMLIVAGVVVVFGGGIGMAMLGGGSSTAPAVMGDETALAPEALPDSSGMVELSGSAEMPPMPAPIDSGTDASPGAPGEALTPMPTPADLQNTELAELNVEEIPAAPAGKTVAPGAEPFDFKEAPKESAPAPEEQIVLQPDPVMPIPAAEETPVAAPAENATQVDLSPQIEAQAKAVENLQSDVNGKIESLAGQLSELAAQTQKSSEATSAQIDRLAKSVEALETQVAELAQRPVAAPEASSPAPAAIKEIPLPVEEQKEPEPVALDIPPVKSTVREEAPKKAAVKPVAPAKAKPAKAPSWVMKSAQPGKAVLSSKTTGDLKNVAVGDKVEGLGRITAIGLENGRWTVRGTNGTVSR